MNPRFQYSTHATNDANGYPVAGYGFEFEGMFITDACRSECSRFPTSPDYYGLTRDDAGMLALLNDSSVQKLSFHFARSVRLVTTPGELTEINHKNATDPDCLRGLCCASHDYIDANECMLSAMEICGMVQDAADPLQARVIDAAWNAAKLRGFDVPESVAGLLADLKRFLDSYAGDSRVYDLSRRIGSAIETAQKPAQSVGPAVDATKPAQACIVVSGDPVNRNSV